MLEFFYALITFDVTLSCFFTFVFSFFSAPFSISKTITVRLIKNE